ncbi:uncharacterized protein LOC121339955 isoform X5 [Onychostruthus taczanowskii]|uniref:uncharacterized protein LOC121339955 isoform X5 n=1 Tax=Onychostruthus taczanowskii TaxID=356909 RepID=UPI001B80C72F|nr:uncharacterized protein LOC121339955 isoform X5 [Onychostruthus taczanowskii]
MPSLPQDSPASGLGTGFPMVRGPPSELRDFYVTTYQAAFGKRPTGTPQKLKEGRVSGIEPPGDGSIRPLLGVHTGSGYVVNNYSSLRSLISPHVERHDTDVSTTSEDFKVFGRPDYQRMLPEHVDEPQCPYPTGFSFSRLRFGEVKAPKASGEYGTQSHCASPAKPDVPARVTELSGCTGTAPRSDLTLPEQPLGVGGGRMDSFPGSTPAMGQPAPFAPPELRVGPRGVIAVKVGAAQPCPLCPSLFPRKHVPDPLHPTEATGIQHCPQQVPEQALAAGPRSTRLVGTASNHLGPEICGGHPDPESQWLQHQQPPHHPVAHR